MWAIFQTFRIATVTVAVPISTQTNHLQYGVIVLGAWMKGASPWHSGRITIPGLSVIDADCFWNQKNGSFNAYEAAYSRRRKSIGVRMEQGPPPSIGQEYPLVKSSAMSVWSLFITYGDNKNLWCIEETQTNRLVMASEGHGSRVKVI